MKKLERLNTINTFEKFKIETEKLNFILGGAQSPTGAGEFEMTDWPSDGFNTCVTFTSDTWDGEDHRTMVHFGQKYNCYPVKSFPNGN